MNTTTNRKATARILQAAYDRIGEDLCALIMGRADTGVSGWRRGMGLNSISCGFASLFKSQTKGMGNVLSQTHDHEWCIRLWIALNVEYAPLSWVNVTMQAPGISPYSVG